MPTIQNKTRSKILYPRAWGANNQPILDEPGKVISDFIKAGEIKNVTDAQFKHLKAIFHHQIVDVNNLVAMQQSAREDRPQAPATKPEGYMSPLEVEEAKRVAIAEAFAAAGKPIPRTAGEAQSDEEKAAHASTTGRKTFFTEIKDVLAGKKPSSPSDEDSAEEAALDAASNEGNPHGAAA